MLFNLTHFLKKAGQTSEKMFSAKKECSPKLFVLFRIFVVKFIHVNEIHLGTSWFLTATTSLHFSVNAQNA